MLGSAVLYLKGMRTILFQLWLLLLARPPNAVRSRHHRVNDPGVDERGEGMRREDLRCHCFQESGFGWVWGSGFGWGVVEIVMVSLHLCMVVVLNMCVQCQLGDLVIWGVPKIGDPNIVA